MFNKDKVSFKELLIWCSLSVPGTAKLCGKSERTIQNYIKTNKPCIACKKLITWKFYGIHQDVLWQDWKIRDNNLISPAGECFTPKHLEILPILHEWRRLQEADIKLKEQEKFIKIKNMPFY